MTVGVRRHRSALARCLAVAALALGATGCGTASDPSPPAGVDQLVIPTPSPDPEDFVTGIDNPWLPLKVGRVWTYDVEAAGGSHRLRVSAEVGPEIAGVATTAVETIERRTSIVDWYAQDRAGNVWWLGREGVWQAGAGAEAGLAMPATPRVGDGFRTAYDEGVLEDVATVLDRDGAATVGAGTFGDLLVLEVESPLEAGARERSYAVGVGLVQERATGGPSRTLRLAGVEERPAG